MPWYTSPITVIIISYVSPVLSFLMLLFIKRNRLYISVPITALIDVIYWGFRIINGTAYISDAFIFTVPKWIYLFIISFVIMTVDKILNKKQFK